MSFSELLWETFVHEIYKFLPSSGKIINKIRSVYNTRTQTKGYCFHCAWQENCTSLIEINSTTFAHLFVFVFVFRLSCTVVVLFWFDLYCVLLYCFDQSFFCYHLSIQNFSLVYVFRKQLLQKVKFCPPCFYRLEINSTSPGNKVNFISRRAIVRREIKWYFISRSSIGRRSVMLSKKNKIYQ